MQSMTQALLQLMTSWMELIILTWELWGCPQQRRLPRQRVWGSRVHDVCRPHHTVHDDVKGAQDDPPPTASDDRERPSPKFVRLGSCEHCSASSIGLKDNELCGNRSADTAGNPKTWEIGIDLVRLLPASHSPSGRLGKRLRMVLVGASPPPHPHVQGMWSPNPAQNRGT